VGWTGHRWCDIPSTESRTPRPHSPRLRRTSPPLRELSSKDCLALALTVLPHSCDTVCAGLNPVTRLTSLHESLHGVVLPYRHAHAANPANQLIHCALCTSRFLLTSCGWRWVCGSLTGDRGALVTSPPSTAAGGRPGRSHTNDKTWLFFLCCQEHLVIARKEKSSVSTKTPPFTVSNDLQGLRTFGLGSSRACVHSTKDLRGFLSSRCRLVDSPRVRLRVAAQCVRGL